MAAYRRVDGIVTCGLTACTPGSAPGPTLGNEYGKLYLFTWGRGRNNKLFTRRRVHAGLGSEDEVKLVNSLFENDGYNPLIRPVRNLSETVTVKFGLAMIQLINVVSNCSTHTHI